MLRQQHYFEVYVGRTNGWSPTQEMIKARQVNLQVFFERCYSILRFAELVQPGCQSLDGVVLTLPFRGEENVVQLKELEERLGGGVHVPATTAKCCEANTGSNVSGSPDHEKWHAWHEEPTKASTRHT